RRTTLVPHANEQSVRYAQGPWDPRHPLADECVDRAARPTARARLRDQDEALALLRAQADRSRTGRRSALPERWLTAPGTSAD
ncbi:hypothetical protein ABZ686_15085, partial [Streptomyces sp. NPDC006992]